MTKKALTLTDLFHVAAKNAARMFETSDDHEVLPMWHVVAGNGDNILVATPWSDDDEKDNALDAMRVIFRKHHAKRFAFITEAWIRQAASLEDASNGRVSEHEDRREVLMVSAEDRDGRALMGWFYILRPEHGPPKLSEFHTQPFNGQVGRMHGLLT